VHVKRYQGLSLLVTKILRSGPKSLLIMLP
jgi:hypothetical protein